MRRLASGMIAVALFWLAGVTAEAGPAQPRTSAAAPAGEIGTLEALYARGQTFDEFLAGVQERRGQWRARGRAWVVPDDLRARAAQVPGTWRLLVVTVDACSDSVSTVPYLARLVEAVGSLELRVVDSSAGCGVMEAHRTPDGRAATPTVVLLGGDGREMGCWVERPSALQAWVTATKSTIPDDDLYAKKAEWYVRDDGASTVREIVEMLEAAAAGTPKCETRQDAPR